MAKPKKPLVIVTRKLPDSVETRMRELFDTRLNLDDKPMSQAAARRGAEDRRRAGADRHRPHRRAALISEAGDQPEADRQFRQRRRQHRRRRPRSQRGITVTNTPGVLTEDTADMTMALILAVPRRLAEGASVLSARQRMGRLVADLDARPPHLGQAARHHRHGPDRPGGGAPRRGLRPADPLSQPPPRRRRRSRRSWRRPTGRASTRCWPAWTSSRSTARTRRRPITCCRRGG